MTIKKSGIFSFGNNRFLQFVILSTIVFVSRLPFIAAYLWHYDSANYALGIRNFDVVHHQPHFPGYFLYVKIAWLMNSFLKDENLSLVTVSIIFALLTSYIFFLLLEEIFKSRLFAYAGTLILIFNPFFWMVSEVASNDTPASFIGTFIAFLSLRYIRGNNRWYLFATAFVWGISGGFRLDGMIALSPIITSAFLKGRTNGNPWLNALTTVFAAIIGVCIWLIPTIHYSGGLSSFLNAPQYIFDNYIAISFLLKGNYAPMLGNMSRLYNYYLDAYWYLFILAGVVVVVNFRRLFSLSSRDHKKSSDIYYILSLWFFPLLIMHIMIWVGREGYIALSFPVILIAILVLINALVSTSRVVLLWSGLAMISGVLIFLGGFGQFNRTVIASNDAFNSSIVNNIKTYVEQHNDQKAWFHIVSVWSPLVGRQLALYLSQERDRFFCTYIIYDRAQCYHGPRDLWVVRDLIHPEKILPYKNPLSFSQNMEIIKGSIPIAENFRDNILIVILPPEVSQELATEGLSCQSMEVTSNLQRGFSILYGKGCRGLRRKT